METHQNGSKRVGFCSTPTVLAKSLCHSNISLSHRLPLAEGWLLQGGPSAAGFPGAHHIWSSTALLNFCPWMSELGTLSVVPGNSSSSKDCCQAGNAALSMLPAKKRKYSWKLSTIRKKLVNRLF